ncbi:MAG: HD domain-containing protein [Deltaproteobacteria bacterium]|nr:HD domain-containing protein [Deltaproteobacteria bacterium]
MEPTERKATLFSDLVRALSLAMDLDGGHKLYHAWRVGVLSERVARHLDGAEPETAFLAGVLHDIGAAGMADHVVHVLPRGPASDAVRQHPAVGAAVLAPFRLLRPVADIVADHHENTDGSGYPHGKCGPEIAAAASVVSLADTLEIGMRGQTGERRATTAWRILRGGRGTRWPAHVVDAAYGALHGEPDLLAGLYEEETLTRWAHEVRCAPAGLAECTEHEMLCQLLWLFVRLLEAKHPATLGHSVRTAFYAQRIARAAALTETQLWDVLWASLLHDVGKLGVRRELLERQAPLSADEWNAVKKHAADSMEIIGTIGELGHLAYPAASHHERYDGTGYPLGLKGDAIPLLGRILAYADTFDAMTSRHVHRDRMPAREAIQHMHRLIGGQLDPHLAEVAMAELEQCSADESALATELADFRAVFESDQPDLDRLVGVSGARTSYVQSRARGMILTDVEPFHRVTVNAALEILDGREHVASVAGASSAALFHQYFDAHEHNAIRGYAAGLAHGQVTTRLLMTADGGTAECVFERESATGTLRVLIRNASHRLRTLKHLSLFHRSFLTSAEGVFIVDDALCIVDANQCLLDMLGYTLEELRGQPAAVLSPLRQPPGLTLFSGARRRAVPGAWSGDLALERKDGREIPVHFSLSTVRDAFGQSAGFIARATDITERKRLELELAEKNRRLEELSRFKSDIVAIASHDLKTPLAAILAWTELLADDLAAQGRPDAARNIGHILEAGHKMSMLIRDLLDLARIESGTLTIHGRAALLETIIEDCISIHAPGAVERGIQLKFRNDAPRVRVNVDDARLEQVLNNLLSNAVKYSPRGSCVEIMAAHAAGGAVSVAVLDGGPGIPEGELERIFERYAQGAPPLEHRGAVGASVGMGLHIARSIVQLHGGSLLADNRPGGGSCFTLTLPPERVLSGAAVATAVLATSDDRALAQFSEILARQHISAVVASHPGQLPALVDGGSPRLCVVDLRQADNPPPAWDELVRAVDRRGPTRPLLVALGHAASASVDAVPWDRVLEPPLLDVEILELLRDCHIAAERG